ncbi:MAG TPA: peroxiredoxin-like family protein [Methyloceanibacter sp.]|nr:peroxiredoxin-like family protein [Methyloceanibacter sp.]
MNQAKSLDQALAEAFLKADHLPAPLDQRLKLYLGESRQLLPEMEATYDQLVARISNNIQSSNQVPAVGEALPEFCLTDSEGKLVELAALLDKGPLVICFNRGPWCDYCGLELHSLARAYPDIVAAGGEVVSIVPETAKYARNLQAAREVPFRVLTDMDLGYALSLGLAFWVGQKIMDMYRGFGIDLAQFQGNGGWFLPIPATLVVGRDGLVKARFVDPDFRHRMRTEDIVEAVREAAQD